MKSIPRTQLLDSLEGKAEQHLQEAVNVFQNLSEQALNQPAADGGWSIAQCLEHLNSYGHYYLFQIGKGLDQHPVQPSQESFTSTWLGNYFTRLMDPQTGKRKFSAFKSHVPAANLDAYAVVAEFIHQQETLLSYLQRCRSADLDAIKIPVSIAKWVKLKLGDVLGFVIAHNARHLAQAKRNLPLLLQAG